MGTGVIVTEEWIMAYRQVSGSSNLISNFPVEFKSESI